MKGQLLVALGRDADNRIYPIAWAVVQVENIDNWLWFIKRIKSDLNLGNGEGFVMVSDRQKGLIKAVQQELPDIEHRMCVRHIYGNLKARHGKKIEMKPLLWKLAWSYSETEYEENLASLKAYDKDVFEDVMKSKPKTWCRAFFKIGNCCEDVENNSTESFNKTIVNAREKPLVPMLETIRRLAMVRISTRSIKATKHTGKCTPYVAAFLKVEHKKASLCKVYPSTHGMFEVHLGGCQYRVCMRRRTCTCHKWELTGIPCEHAYGVILSKKLEAEDYVSEWFYTSRWRNTYYSSIIPLRGARFWAKGFTLMSEPPVPPQPGRKKSKEKKQPRKKGKNESPTKKKPKLIKRTMHCGLCGKGGHNSRSCEKRKKKASENGEFLNQTMQMGPSQSQLSPWSTKE